MASRHPILTASLAIAGVVALCGPALAQTGSTVRTPTQADSDLCNREAQAALGGSASPSSGVAPSPAPSTSGGPIGGAPGATGATGGTGSLSGGSTLSSGPSTTTGDPRLRGMASSGANDPAFQQAFRDCMRRRGF
jgi:hypothetical protein